MGMGRGGGERGGEVREGWGGEGRGGRDGRGEGRWNGEGRGGGRGTRRSRFIARKVMGMLVTLVTSD